MDGADGGRCEFGKFQHEPFDELWMAAVGRRPKPCRRFMLRNPVLSYKVFVLLIINGFHLTLHLFGA